MLSTAVPRSFPLAFAQNAAGPYIRPIPTASQIGSQDGAASLNDGFVPDNFLQIAAGGVPPFGQDMNGILNQITAWCQWIEAGGPVGYDPTFATAIGGYPKGSILRSTVLVGAEWYSTVESNLTNPDDPLTSSGWVRFGVPAGAPLPFFGAVPTGFVSLNAGLTIGSASSGASYAAADAIYLFFYNWPNSQLTIYTSAGAVTSRGANAVADFNAGKRLAVPDARGAGLIGIDNGTTNLNGVPVVSGNTTTPGSIIGENLHTLILSEIPSHQHNVYLKDLGHNHIYNGSTTVVPQGTLGNGLPGPVSALNTSTSTTGITIGSVNGVANDNQTAAAGGGGSHNTVQRSLAVNWGQKL